MLKFVANRITAATALLILCSGIAYAEQRTEQYEFTAGQNLELDLKSGGSVSASGWDQPGIEVVFDGGDRGLDDFRIAVTPTADGLKIHTELKQRNSGSNLRLNLRVPRNLSIDLDSAGGSVALANLSGAFRGGTGGGSMNLKNLTGQIDLRTGGGRIEVADSTLDGEVRTGGGKVLVSNVVGDLQARSGGGNVVYKNVRSNTGDMRTPKGLAGKQTDSETVLIKSAGGRINVDAAPSGARVETGGGSVKVRNAERFIEARTGGGDIDLELGEGWIKANTGAGDVEVTVLRDIAGDGDIEIINGHGDVSLTLPANFSMNVDIELGVTKNASGSPKISSDFPLQIEQSDDWDYSKGTPRKYIRATGTPGGGLHRLRIRTTNGNVVIRRAS